MDEFSSREIDERPDIVRALISDLHGWLSTHDAPAVRLTTASITGNMLHRSLDALDEVDSEAVTHIIQSQIMKLADRLPRRDS